MHITGVVLAGGLSQRMGRDKATLQRNGQSMLAFGCELLQTLPLQDIVISANTPHPVSYRSVADHYPKGGPLSGLHAVMATLYGHTDALLCLPVDQPHMTTEPLLRLIHAGQSSTSAVHFSQQPLPLWLPVRTNILNELEARLSQPIQNKRLLGLGHFCQCVGAEILSTEQTHIWLNTNTPEQWREAQQTPFQ